ncbi:ATPase [Petroclostridium sp. X23]|uniref:ATPase n=1 Tax=Petroclostridium sp. X23 TaxID=3045146 RepID=UPI0024ADD693|nr:ATPase [Petroclostridium sp. X23]WHH59883.1 ATPase [Petroclostridium sp. X23]
MEVFSLVDTLEDIVERGVPIPLSGKSVVNKEDILELIQEIRLKLPEDLKQAKWVKEERQRILLEAQKEANNIIKDAENKIISMIDEHELTKRAYEQASEIISNAQKNAREIRLGTKEYADDILSNLEKIIQDTMDVLRENRQELKK